MMDEEVQEVAKKPQTDLLPVKAFEEKRGALIPPERFVGALKSHTGREVEVDPDLVFECRMAGAGTTPLRHTKEGLQALRVRLAAAARELRMVFADFYTDPSAPRVRGAIKNVFNAEAVALTDIDDALKEAV